MNFILKYTPILALVLISLLLSLIVGFHIDDFMGYFLVLLSTLKLIDLPSFQKSFLKYDLISKKINFYGYLYPFLELYSGLFLLNKSLSTSTFVTVSALMISVLGLAGCLSVIKSVYIDKLNFNCACIGGNSKLPLGFVSLLENLMMLVMGLKFLIS